MNVKYLCTQSTNQSQNWKKCTVVKARHYWTSRVWYWHIQSHTDARTHIITHRHLWTTVSVTQSKVLRMWNPFSNLVIMQKNLTAVKVWHSKSSHTHTDTHAYDLLSVKQQWEASATSWVCQCSGPLHHSCYLSLFVIDVSFWLLFLPFVSVHWHFTKIDMFIAKCLHKLLYLWRHR